MHLFSQGLDVDKKLWEIASLTLDPDIRQFILEECLSYSLTPQQASDVKFLKQLEKATIEKQQSMKTTSEKTLRYFNSIYLIHYNLLAIKGPSWGNKLIINDFEIKFLKYMG